MRRQTRSRGTINVHSANGLRARFECKHTNVCVHKYNAPARACERIPNVGSAKKKRFHKFESILRLLKTKKKPNAHTDRETSFFKRTISAKTEKYTWRRFPATKANFAYNFFRSRRPATPAIERRIFFTSTPTRPGDYSSFGFSRKIQFFFLQ